MHFINKNLNNDSSSDQGDFFYFDNSNESPHSLNMNEIIEFKKLSKFALFDKKTILRKFNELKTQFLLLNSGYKSEEDYFQKHEKLGDSFEITKSFLKFLNSQIPKSEKNFSEFKKFLNYELSFERKMSVDSIDKNGFYFLEKVEDPYIAAGNGLERANIYSVRVRGSNCQMRWEQFHKVASKHDSFNEMINALTEETGCFFITNIINPDELDDPELYGVFALKQFKYIDNPSLIEQNIESVLSQEDYSKLVFDSYGKTFEKFLEDHLRISGKDIYISKRIITEQEKLNKVNLINLTTRDINALETERTDYANLSENVFECLIQNYNHEIPFSNDFKDQSKDLFHYLEDKGCVFFERFQEKQSFKIRKFYNYTYSGSSKSLEKFFVICAISDKNYNDSFPSFKMNQDSINLSKDIFSESLFNLGQKHSASLFDVNVFFNGIPHKFIFDHNYYEGLHYNMSITEFVKDSMNNNEFLIPGIEMLITDNVQLNDDNFYNYYFQFNNVATFLHAAIISSLRDYIFNDYIYNPVSQAGTISQLESSISRNSFEITFNKNELFTKNLAHKQEYYLLEKSKPEINEFFEYFIMDYKPDERKGPIRLLNLVSSVTRDKIYSLSGTAYKKNISFNDLVSVLKKYPKKYLNVFNEQKDLKRFLESVTNHSLISEHGYKIIPLDFFGIPTDKNFYKKTVLYLNEVDHSFYEIDLFTPYGNIEGNNDYNNLDKIGFISTNKHEIFSAFDKKTGLPIFLSGSHLNEVFYYIENKSDIKSLGNVASIKTDGQYQKLTNIFKGKGYEEFNNDRFLDNQNAQAIYPLLINNVTAFPVVKGSRIIELDDFDLYHVLASESEFIEVLIEAKFPGNSIELALKTFITKPSEQIVNKDVYLKYKGVYYDPINIGKKVIEVKNYVFSVYEENNSESFLNLPQDNYISKHGLYSISCSDDVFVELINKMHKDISPNIKDGYASPIGLINSYFEKYYVKQIGENFTIKRYIDEFKISTWGSVNFNCNHDKLNLYCIYFQSDISNGKSLPVYYFDKETNIFWRIEREYTMEFKNNKKGYESGLMQCKNINQVKNWGDISRGFAVYSIRFEQNIRHSDLANLPCYSYEKNFGSVENALKSHGLGF
jgi:hypothetical protein